MKMPTKRTPFFGKEAEDDKHDGEAEERIVKFLMRVRDWRNEKILAYANEKLFALGLTRVELGGMPTALSSF